ncbi:MAG: diguanylate cyclase [Magnetococcales bacterium]|nr:diguanylate cyclase [Magnetococcales bacterium]
MPIFSSHNACRTFFRFAMEPVIVIDKQGLVVNLNDSAEQLFEYTQQNVVGKQLADLIIPEETRQDFQKHFNVFVSQDFVGKKGKRDELKTIKSTGEYMDSEVITSQIDIDGTIYIAVCIQDITERKQIINTMSQALDTLEKTNKQLQTEINQRKQMEGVLLQQEQLYRSIVESTAEGFWMFSPHSLEILETNDALCKMFGLTREDIIGKTPLDFIDQQEIPKVKGLVPQITTSNHRNFDTVFKTKKKGLVSALVNCTTINNSEGEPNGVFAFLTDITERKLIEEKAHRAHVFRIAISALLETGLEPLTLSQQLQVGLDIIMTVPKLSTQYQGAIFLWDESIKKLTMMAQYGMPNSLASACSHINSGHCLCGKAFERSEAIFVERGKLSNTETLSCSVETSHFCIPILSRERTLGVLLLSVKENYSDDQDESAFLSTIGVTLASLIERRKADEEIQNLVMNDALTKLPNRRTFEERLNQALINAKREKLQLAVMFLDLDGFKYINDTYGHKVGDIILFEAAQRIKKCLREVDTVARIGGDEFTTILHSISNNEDAGIVADKIINSISKPFHIDKHICNLGVSIGISIFPEHGNDLDTLLKKADMAMYEVKKTGRGMYMYFL